MKLLFENWRGYLKEDKAPKEPEIKVVLQKIGLAYSRWLGSGYFGSVIEVEDPETGERNAAKIVADQPAEERIYSYVMNNRSKFGEYAKYLPDVKQFITGGGSTIILMELLEPLDPQTAQELFAAQDAPTASKKPEKILKDPEAVAEIVEKAIEHNRILDQMRLTPEQYSEITSVAVNAATQAPLSDADELINTIYGAVVGALTFQSPAISRAFWRALRDTVRYYFDKQIIPVHQPEEDEDQYDTWTSGGLPKTSVLFPEAEGLLSAMKYFMQDKQWKPKDVHINNVMRRPDTKDFVIVDLGLFSRGIYENLNVKAKILDLDNPETPEAFKRMFGGAG